MKTRESIPKWALCYCVNGNSAGLSEEEIAMIDKWIENWKVEIISPIADEEGNYHTFFTHYPLLGAATTAVECEIIYHNDNPINPQLL